MGSWARAPAQPCPSPKGPGFRHGPSRLDRHRAVTTASCYTAAAAACNSTWGGNSGTWRRRLAASQTPGKQQLFWSQGRCQKPRAAAGASCQQVLCPDGWPLWTMLLTCAAVGQLADARTKLGGLLGGPLVSMLCAALLASCSVIPVDTVVYDTVWKYLMPMAAACFLLDTDTALLISTGGSVLLSFIIGAVGMVLGAVLGSFVLVHHMGPQGACMAAALCASYVGGSINFVAISQAVGLSAEHIPVAMAADNLAMAAYLAVLMAVPVHAACSSSSSNTSAVSDRSSPAAPSPSAVTAGTISLSLACAAAACSLSQPLAAALNLRPLALTIMAGIAMSLSAALRRVLQHTGADAAETMLGAPAPVQGTPSLFAGSAQIGGALMLVFFAVIGASAGGLFRPGAGAGGVLLAMLGFLTIMVVVHWAVLAAAGRLLGLPTQALLLGSNACIGGPATAASMAMSKGWTSMTQTSMLVGSLGYAIGTAAGLAVYSLVRMLKLPSC